MAVKGVLPPTLKMVLKKYYPLPVHPLSGSPHPEIPSWSPLLPCTEPESSGDDQTESGYFGAPADGPKEERSEIMLAVQPDYVTGKHRDREQTPLERVQLSGGEGKVVTKRAFPVLKSPSAGKGLEGLKSCVLRCNKLRWTDFRTLTAQGPRIRGENTFSSRRQGEPRKNHTRNHRSLGCKTVDELATARDNRMEYRAKQAV